MSIFHCALCKRDDNVYKSKEKKMFYKTVCENAVRETEYLQRKVIRKVTVSSKKQKNCMPISCDTFQVNNQRPCWIHM